MTSSLSLTIGYAIDGTPSCLYIGPDFNAAASAASVANAAGTPLVQVYRNLPPAFQELRPPPTGARVFNTIPTQTQLASGLAG